MPAKSFPRSPIGIEPPRGRVVARLARHWRTAPLFVTLAWLGMGAPSHAGIDNYGLIAGLNSTTPGQAVMFDTSTNAPLGTITTPNYPGSAVFSPDGRFVYTANASGSVSVIDVQTRAIVATVVVGHSPSDITISPDGQFLYVVNLASNTVSVIATATNTVVGSPIPVGTQPMGAAVSPDGSTIYVTNSISGSVSIIDATTNTVVGTVAVTGGPAGVVVSPDGSKVYVVGQAGGNVSVIDTATQTVTATITVGSLPLSAAVTPDGGKLYVTSQTSNRVSVIDTATNTVVATIPLANGGNGVAITPDGSLAYVTLGDAINVNGTDAVVVIDTATNTVIGSFSSGIGSTGTSYTGWIGPNVIVSSGGPVSVANDAALATLGFGSFVDFNGGTLKLTGALNTARTFSLLTLGGVVDTNGFNATISGAIVNSGSLTKQGLGTLTLSGANTYTGATYINGGTLALSGLGSIATSAGVNVGAGATFDIAGTTAGATIKTLAGVAGATVNLGSQTLTLSNASSTFGGAITGTGGLTLLGGYELLTGTSTYTGATTINGGTLEVDGSLADPTVNSGGTLAGTGSVGDTTVNSGGTFAPGSSGTPGTMNVNGALTFASGSTYAVEVTPAAASKAAVTGTATLAGTLKAIFGSGTYLTKNYTILSASSLSGTFGTFTTVGLPVGVTASVDYSVANSVMLDLNAQLQQVDGLNQNQQNVANALDGYFNNGGTLPPGFVTIFGLSGSSLATALTQLSGEAATGAQQGAFQMMGLFLDRMTDPFVDGRGGDDTSGTGALGYAAERKTLSPEAASAYASAMKAPAKTAFGKRWSLWGSAYGATNRTGGDLNATGSNDLSARVSGFAAGADYRLSPSTMLGFALAGGETNWSLAQGLGGGRGDAFQAGLYGKTQFGPAYVAASFAAAQHWMSTDRTAYAADHLTASFNAQSYGGRLETGYRFAGLPIAVTPYAAAQAQAFVTPAYNESDVTGGGYALTYAGRTATDTRGELGTRFDRAVALDQSAALMLRAKLAYAHDWVSDPSLNATFQALSGASFIVNGATPAHDSGLVSAGADLHLANGVVLGAKFDGEFSAHAQTYAGTATLRYLW